MTRLSMMTLFLVACSDKVGGAGEGSTACSTWFPVDQVGANWEYAYSSVVDGSYTNVAVGEELFEGLPAWRVDSDARYTLDGETVTQEISTWYRCTDEGVHYAGFEIDTTLGGESNWTLTIYDTQPLVVPVEMAVGDTWTTRFLGTRTSSYDEAESIDMTTTYSVTGAERITVEAGTFDTLAVAEDMGDTPGEVGIDANYAAGVGLIQSELVELLYSSLSHT